MASRRIHLLLSVLQGHSLPPEGETLRRAPRKLSSRFWLARKRDGDFKTVEQLSDRP